MASSPQPDGVRKQRRPAVAPSPIQLQKYLGGTDYPISKPQLVDHARKNGAEEDVIHLLERLPYEEFNSPNDVSEAFAKAGD
jgi:hypothetical protein